MDNTGTGKASPPYVTRLWINAVLLPLRPIETVSCKISIQVQIVWALRVAIFISYWHVYGVVAASGICFVHARILGHIMIITHVCFY